MRVNTRDVLKSWQGHGVWKHADSIHTDGETIYSYNTALVARTKKGDRRIIFNRTKYSQTTTIHQNSLAVYIHADVVLTKVPMGTQDLEAYMQSASECTEEAK